MIIVIVTVFVAVTRARRARLGIEESVGMLLQHARADIFHHAIARQQHLVGHTAGGFVPVGEEVPVLRVQPEAVGAPLVQIVDHRIGDIALIIRIGQIERAGVGLGEGSMLRAGEPVRMRVQERRADRVQARIGEIARAVEHHVEHNLQAAFVRTLDQPPQPVRVAVGRRDVLKVDHRIARPREGRHDLNGVKAHVPNLFHLIGQFVKRIDQRAVALFADKNLQQIDRPQRLFVVVLVPVRRLEALGHLPDGRIARTVVQQKHKPADRLLIAPPHHAGTGDPAHARQVAAAIQSVGRAGEEIAQKPRRLHGAPFRVIAAHHARAVVGRGAGGNVRYDVVALPAVEPTVQIDRLVDAGHRARPKQLHAGIVLLLSALDRPFKEAQALRLLAVIAQYGGHLQ